MKSIGLRIKEARLARNMKQEELAERIGAKSPSAVSTWESGRAKPDCVTLLKICNVLEVSADSLLVDVVDHATKSVASELSAAIEDLPHDEKMRILKAVSALVEK